MTSTYARNAATITSVTKIRYLKSNKDGLPLDKQVPRSVQLYTGTGGAGEILDYDGSNDVVIMAGNLTGNLIVRFIPPADPSHKFNLLGREAKIHVSGATTRTITLSSSPSQMKINSTGLTQVSHVIMGDLLSKTVTVSFVTADMWNVDYGASVNSIAPAFFPNAQISRKPFLFPSGYGISSLIKGGVAPYTCTAAPGFVFPADSRLGYVEVDNPGGSVTYWPPSGHGDVIFNIPLTITDALGQSTVTEMVVIPNRKEYPAGQPEQTSICTCIATVDGTQGIYSFTYSVSGGGTETTNLVYKHDSDIVNFATDQDTTLIYFTTVGSGYETIFWYDPIKEKSDKLNGIKPLIAAAGLSDISCMGFDHEAGELYLFGANVTEPVYIMKPRRFQRYSGTMFHGVRSCTILKEPLNPVAQTYMSDIFGKNTFVTGCEFVDTQNLMVLSFYDPDTDKTFSITFNKSMFKRRGTPNSGAVESEQCIVGVRDYSNNNPLRVAFMVFGYKIAGYYSLVFLKPSTGEVESQVDYGWIADLSIPDFNYIPFTVPGTLPSGASARASRNLIGF
jgi:hypothetical protein